jgi:hypothetical protein
MFVSKNNFGLGRLALLLIAAITFGGCATMPGQNLTPEEQQMRADASVFDETVLGGAAMGAALGCAVGYFWGGEAKDCLVGGIGGGALGALGGYLTATEQEAARGQVRQVDIVTRDINADNENLRRLVASASRVLDQNRQQAQLVKQKLARAELAEGELASMRARLRSNIAFMNETIVKLEEKRSQYVEAANSLAGKGQDTSGLRRRVGDMENHIAALIEYRDTLEEQLNVELVG